MAHDHDNHGSSESAVTNGDGDLYGVLAEYDTPGELIAAARKVRDAGYTDFDCFSPFPVHGIDEAMGIKRTILPLLIFGGGFAGAIGGILLQWWTNAYNWPWNISGKPAWSIPANVPIAFETTILLSVFTAFFGMWILNKLPQVWHPFFRLDRFARVTDDAFLLGIEAKDQRFDLEKTTALLKDAGALEVERCYYENDPARKYMPKWITALIVSSTAFALIPFAIAAKARNSHSADPHIHIFADMDFQPKFKADTASDMFEDGRANRGEVPGTVARGGLHADELFYEGKENGDWTQGFPKNIEITPELVKRGQGRYNIYCAPCHGYDGRGEGPIRKRLIDGGAADWAVRNLVAPPWEPGGQVVRMPNGQLFNTISNGYATMSGYSSQISHRDRWAIVLYVRALERAANAQQTDVPQGDIRNMPAPQQPSLSPAVPPPSGSPAVPPATGSAAGGNR